MVKSFIYIFLNLFLAIGNRLRREGSLGPDRQTLVHHRDGGRRQADVAGCLRGRQTPGQHQQQQQQQQQQLQTLFAGNYLNTSQLL